MTSRSTPKASRSNTQHAASYKEKNIFFNTCNLRLVSCHVALAGKLDTFLRTWSVKAARCLWLPILFLAGLMLDGCGTEGGTPHDTDSMVFPDTPFDLQKVLELESFGEPGAEDALSKPYVLVVYFHQLTCNTCLNTSLSYLNEMYESASGNLGFLAVVHGEDFQYLRNLRRIGKVTYPILMERVPGEAGLLDHFNISLVDVSRQRLLVRYFPTTANLGLLPELREHVNGRITEP